MVFHGASSFSASTLEQWTATRVGAEYDSGDAGRITAGYAAEGFPFARIDSVVAIPLSDSVSVDLNIWVTEGAPAVVASLLIEGVKALDTGLVRSVMETGPGKKFMPPQLDRDISALLDLYQRSGYPFATVRLGKLRFDRVADTAFAYIGLTIDEGSLARIAWLHVDGNTLTRTGVVARAARLREGELFTGDQPELVRRRIQRLELFSNVSLPELSVDSAGRMGLTVKVSEGNPNRFDGIVGYIPSSGPGSPGYVTGLLDIQFRNILGTGRWLSARWYRENQASQEIGLRYREPWVASLPVHVEAGFNQRKQDSTFVRNLYDGAAELMVTDALNLGVLFSSEQVLPTEGYGTRALGKSHSLSFGVSLTYDSRDDPVTPSAGLRYHTEYSTGSKESDSPVKGVNSIRSATQRLAFDIQYFVSPLRHQVVAVGVYARDFRSGGVGLSDLYRLGGAVTLRGYREGQFLGSRVAWTNLEYRFLTGGRSYAFGFTDFGYALIPSNPDQGLARAENARMGYGIGVRLDTPLGLMGLSLAFGKGDTFSTSKLHLQLINEF